MVTVNTETAKIVLAKAIEALYARAQYHHQLHYDEVKNSVWIVWWLFVPLKHWFKQKQDADIQKFIENDIWSKHHWNKHNCLFSINEAKKLLMRIDCHEAMTYNLSNEEFNLYTWGLE